jgi:signal transduction histidine kinase/CHASE2 domain-containing sensor protein
MNNPEGKPGTLSRLKPAVWPIAIVLVSAILAMSVGWRAPGLESSARDWLMRQRGLLQVPADIVIVAIDETSLKRFGRFPWQRSLMARALDRLKDAQPKAIALDVLYVEPTNSSDDSALASAISRAGNVVVAAQLTADVANEDEVSWLRPLPEIESNAAGVGHVDVHTGFDGVARALLLRQADDQARSFWAMALELIRVGDGLTAEAVRELPHAVALGKRVIPVITDPGSDLIESQGTSPEHIRAPRLLIDYIGPSGSFATQTVSLSEVVDGRVDLERLRGKYVLIGATAATLGEQVASPFIHSVNRGRLRSNLMPGVEILANQVNTILRERFYQDIPAWITFLCSASVAFGVIIFAALAQGSYEIMRQIAALIILLALILLSSYLVFSRWLILPPLVPVLLAFAIATPMALLRRSFVLSHEITSRIAELSHAGQSLLPSMNDRAAAAPSRLSAAGEDPKARRPWRWPRGAEWRARELRGLNQELLQRALFVDRALRSVDDGLIIAATDARIVFANPRAVDILGKTEGALAGSDLFERISEAESSHTLQPSTLVSRLQSAQAARESLQHLLDSRQSIEREITLSSGSNNTRHYSLRISTVSDSAEGAVIGIVAAFTDITRHRELQRTQRDVMALVTHELKTPLTAIQGLSEVLSHYEVDTLKRREMHSTINEEAKRLARMIDEYLDLTRLESGVRQLRLLPLRVEQLLERALLLLDPVAETRGIKIIRNLAPALPPLLGDADLIARAVTNLVDNAIKFSQPNSTIKVNARADGSGVLIEVIDQGCGIAPQFLGQIFEKFYRVPRAANVDIPGTGLGLALVREVAELHDGLVTVESQPGTGSVFSLYLGLMIRKGGR